MISKHIHCEPKNDNFRRLADYVVAANHEGEKLLLSWCEGCDSGDDFEFAVPEIIDTQDMNTRSRKEKTYHLMISFRPEDESKLSPELFKNIEKEFADALGFTEHQRVCGVHKNTNNLHMHIAYNMIRKEKYTRYEPFRDYWKQAKVCRILEKELGLTVDVDSGQEISSDQKMGNMARTFEARTGLQSFESYAKEQKETILEALNDAENWQDAHTIFADVGMKITPHGGGLAFKDLHGKQSVKASAVDRSLCFRKMQDRFGAFEIGMQIADAEPNSNVIDSFDNTDNTHNTDNGDNTNNTDYTDNTHNIDNSTQPIELSQDKKSKNVVQSIKQYTGQDSFIEYVKEQKEAILTDLNTAENWQDVHNIFAKIGLKIKAQGAGLAIQDLQGKLSAKASIVDRSLSIKRLQDRFGIFEASTKIIEQPEHKAKANNTKYRPKPIQKSVNTHKLWIEFVKISKKNAVEAIKNKWTKKLEELNEQELDKKSKAGLSAIMRNHRDKEINTLYMKQTVKTKNWLEFLREKAQAGDEIALEVLRSREQKAEPEADIHIGNDTDTYKMKSKYLDKKGEILESSQQYKTEKALLELALLEYITQKQCTYEENIPGTITFKLEDGLEIQDDGKQLSFPDEAKDIALKFARAKWRLWNVDIKKMDALVENNTLKRVKLGVFDKSELWREFIKLSQKQAIDEIKGFWNKKKDGLEGKGLDKKSKSNLSARIRNLCEKDINKLYMEQTVKAKGWLDFLREKSQDGDEEALLVLQSQEQKLKPDEDMQVGRDTDKLRMKDEYLGKRENILASSNLQYTSKRRLLDVALLEYITQKECIYDVSSYGALIFKVEGGAKIYDDGKKICFPNGAKDLALNFARAKWGLYNLDIEKMGKLIENNALHRDKATALDKILKAEKAKQQQLAELARLAELAKKNTVELAKQPKRGQGLTR